MNLKTYIEDTADRIVDCIRESDIIDLAGLSIRVRTVLGTGLVSVLRNEESELAERQRMLIEEQADWRTSRERRAAVTAEIQRLSQQRKSIRQTYSRYSNDQRYGKLRAMLRERGHQDLLDEFDAQNGTEEPFVKLK